MSHLYKKHKWRPQAGKVGSLQDHAKQAKQISIYLYEEEKIWSQNGNAIESNLFLYWGLKITHKTQREEFHFTCHHISTG